MYNPHSSTSVEAQKKLLTLVLMTLSIIAAPQAAWTEEEEIEEVLVLAKPIKASQLSSIEAKRNSVNLVDVVSADAIGRFPDTNLADSLGRLPGVSVERDQGLSLIHI